jgi:competence protein ComFC
MLSTIRQFTRELIQFWVYPTCLGCKEESKKLVCNHCERSIQRITHISSTLNHGPYFYGRYEGTLKELLHQFKFENKFSLAPIFSAYILSILPPELRQEIDLIIPVPLPKTRLKERQYNQTALLTNALSKKTSIPVNTDTLQKRETSPQTGLNQTERLKNIKNAFYVTDKGALRDKVILCVDDIYTTGATLNEVKETLRKAGTKKVVLCAVAQRA